MLKEEISQVNSLDIIADWQNKIKFVQSGEPTISDEIQQRRDSMCRARRDFIETLMRQISGEDTEITKI